MKIWEQPKIISLGLKETYGKGNGNGNGEYKDPNNKPYQHPTWEWCGFHGQWHPKNHSINES